MLILLLFLLLPSLSKSFISSFYFFILAFNRVPVGQCQQSLNRHYWPLFGLEVSTIVWTSQCRLPTTIQTSFTTTSLQARHFHSIFLVNSYFGVCFPIWGSKVTLVGAPLILFWFNLCKILHFTLVLHHDIILHRCSSSHQCSRPPTIVATLWSLVQPFSSSCSHLLVFISHRCLLPSLAFCVSHSTLCLVHSTSNPVIYGNGFLQEIIISN